MKDPRVTHENGPCGGHCDRPAPYNEAQLVSSCPIRKLLLHGESPPLEPFIMLATFNGEFIRIVPESSSIYIPERGLTYIQMRERFRQSTGMYQCERSQSSMRCSARMFIIGNTTMIAPSAFSCNGRERKYVRRWFKM